MKGKNSNTLTVYAIIFVLMLVAVFVGNELTSMFDSWNWCRTHASSVSCIYDR